ncbi:MAG: 2Fe-2S iron-sulfur cluster-binding protein [Pseudomonadota bacterium]
MSTVVYRGQTYDIGTQSVLDGLSSHGVTIPSSCHIGVCQTCLMRALSGNAPPKAQAGLKPALAAQNYFLACCCYPEQEIEIALPETNIGRVNARITSLRYLNADILGIGLMPSRPFEYKAGQFINFFKDEYTARCYSLASVPELDGELSLHMKRVPEGVVSSWIFRTAQPGDTVTISEAMGDCFYTPGKPEQNILLIGTGSGLAPLYGIIRDALFHKHSGRICLYHGSYRPEGLYLIDELTRMAGIHHNLTYVPCVSDGIPPPGYAYGPVLDVALQQHSDLSGWRVYLCGNPDMVKAGKKKTFFAGGSMRDILADPFA